MPDVHSREKGTLKTTNRRRCQMTEIHLGDSFIFSSMIHLIIW